MFKLRKKTVSSGQAMIETALIVPILFMVIIGIMEFAFAIHNYLILTNAVNEGARIGAFGGSDDEIRDKVIQESRSLIHTYFLIGKLSGSNIVITPPPASRTKAKAKSGIDIRVALYYNYYINIPYLTETTMFSLPVSAVMKLERGN